MQKEHSPEWKQRREERMKAVLEKSGDKKPMSYYTRHNLALTMAILEGFCYLHEGFCRNLWLFSSPEIPSKDMRKCAGRAMSHAAALGQTEKCKMLHKDFWGNIDEKDYFGDTGLFKAVQRKRLGTAEWFLNEGANPYKKTNGNWNPILIACYNGCIPALRMFKHHGVDFNRPVSFWKKGSKFYQLSKECVYPLEITLSANQPKATKTLLEMGADPDIPCQEKGYSWRQQMDNPKFLEAIGQENLVLLKDYFMAHPISKKRKATFIQRLFAPKGKIR